jgi:hypothetical protein
MNPEDTLEHNDVQYVLAHPEGIARELQRLTDEVERLRTPEGALAALGLTLDDARLLIDAAIESDHYEPYSDRERWSDHARELATRVATGLHARIRTIPGDTP